MSRSLAFSSALLFGVLCAGSALADPTEADRATARSLAGEGYQALQSKDFATAADRFGRADSLVHAPTLMIDWARSLAGLGKLVEAQERYEQIIREGVDPKAPRSWQRALADAGNELAALKPRLAWVTITVSGAQEASVTMDGEAVPPAAVGVRRAANPGQRLVRVRANGFLTQKKTLELAEGAEETLGFTLEPDPDAAVAAPVESEKAPPPVADKGPDDTLMWVAFGVSGAGLVLGGITGAMALSKRSQLEDQCNGNHACRTSQDGALQSYHSLGTVSGIGFAIGVAGAGAGITLWALNRKSSPASTQSLTVRPYIGVACLGATGSF